MEPSSDLSGKRNKLLEMDKKKKAIEADIMSITEALNAPGMPGKAFFECGIWKQSKNRNIWTFGG